MLGKQAGIFGSIVVADKLGFAAPARGRELGADLGHRAAVRDRLHDEPVHRRAGLPGDPELVEEAKLGVLAGSLISALLGYLVLRLARPVEKAA